MTSSGNGSKHGIRTDTVNGIGTQPQEEEGEG